MRKETYDVDNKFTNVSRFGIGLTVTNYGTIGTRNNFWPNQPSCEYPRGSRIEHIYQGGLWVGAVKKDQILVSTGASDQTYKNVNQHRIIGYEFNSEKADSVTELTNLTDDRPPTAIPSARAISHQDFISDYSDLKTRVPTTNDTIENHTPLGLKIHQESYVWNFSYVDFFVILSYTIKNVSADTLDSVYVGLWSNSVVRNTDPDNGVRPTIGSEYYKHTGNAFDSTMRMAYSFDYDGSPGKTPANSYVGIKLLGTTPFPSNVTSLDDLHYHTYYNIWRYNLSEGEAIFLSPTDDFREDNQYLSRYSRLTQSMPVDRMDDLRKTPQSSSYLVSVGPFSQIPPDSSVEVVFSVICAKKSGTDSPSKDTKDQRKNLYANASWAQKVYNGEDVNGNNFLDTGEDIATRDTLGLRYEPDNKITRYLLPSPPAKPKVHAEVGDQSVVVYWDNAAEKSIDPITGIKDFEGYRIYRSNAGSDFLNHDNFLLNLSLIGEFDKKDDNIGYNTGFEKIKLNPPVVFNGDTFSYRFPPIGSEEKLLNGWQYVYAISSFDQGDSINNIQSLESAKASFRVVPGTMPVSGKSVSIGVYPNPYYVNAYWDGTRERLRKIYFYNLPSLCEIRIYTLAGDVVTTLQHDASTYQGGGIEWFNQYGDANTQMQTTGGEHAWDLISKSDQAIATGLYLFTVEDKITGDVKRGKFMIIK